ncbi:MAG: polysaccharide deacetylase family protein, partial [Sedimentisphaerales bacterium]|nr:polysaccharide deacetylase family protein [Sedimentisphaerales bacterium]
MSAYGRHGILVRILYLIIAVVWYGFSLGGRLGKKRLIVLCYHGILPAQGQRFQRQMRGIRGLSVSGNGYAAAMPLKPGAVPGVLVTFDDAFANLRDHAVPVLEEYRIPALVFAVAGNLGRMPDWNMPAGHPERNEETMTVEQLTELSGNPFIRIGSHTMTHPDLTT